jgi:RHS repeat-associated protein
VGLTDSNGTLVETYQYDPDGNLTSSTGSVANPWRFAGGYYDSGTGLYKFGARYYDPTLGRWSQQDPVRGQLTDPNSLNRYLYVGDDPVSLTDPSGMLPPSCVQAITVYGGQLVLALGGDASINAKLFQWMSEVDSGVRSGQIPNLLGFIIKVALWLAVIILGIFTVAVSVYFLVRILLVCLQGQPFS